MLMLKQWQRETLQSAQNAEQTALILARNSLAQVQAVEGELAAFDGAYVGFMTGLVTSFAIQEAEREMSAQTATGSRRRAALYGEPEPDQSEAAPIPAAPKRAALLGAISQLRSGKTNLVAMIQTLEKSTTDRAAQIAALDKGATQ